MRKGLLISTMLVSVAGLGASADVWAQCATTTCSSLGYTSSSNTGNCLKCPFGEAWACPKITCPDNAKYTCSGTNITGGVGIPCNGKYAECACASGYEWKDGSCSQGGCKIGDILYSDKTCSSDVVSGKTPIAVVVYIDGNGGGQALALNNLSSKYYWALTYTDIPNLPNYLAYSNTAQLDFASCENSKIIMDFGDKSTYPAVWATYEYKTEGTKVGDWCLPAAGIFTSYYNNQDKINAGFDKVGGTKFTTSTYAWSSSESDATFVWLSNLSFNYGLTSVAKYRSYEVRPVIEFSFGNSGMPSCDSSYKYTCTGTGYSGGSGTACGGKYKACTCSSGYSWENGSCVKQCQATCSYSPTETVVCREGYNASVTDRDDCGNICYQCCLSYKKVVTDVYCFYADSNTTIKSNCGSNMSVKNYVIAMPYDEIKLGNTTSEKSCQSSPTYTTLSACEQAADKLKSQIGVAQTQVTCYSI